jgi:hypothetical protein
MSSPSPQRPGPLPKSGSGRHHHGNDHHQHSRSWTARLYRKHDAKHHRPENQPLLADDNIEEPEPSEAVSDPEEEPSRCRNCFSGATHGPIRLFKKLGKWSKNGITAAGDAAKSAGNAVKGAAEKVASGTKNNPKKVMAGTIAILTAATIALSATLILDQIQHKNSVELCTTPGCVEASDFILRNLDPDLISDISSDALDYRTTSIDPCTDFDQFVCGGFRKRFDLREDQGDMYTGKSPTNGPFHTTDRTGSLVTENVESIIRHVVTKDDSKLPSKDLVIVKKLQQAFDACMDTSATEKAGLKPLQDVVDHIKELLPTTSLARDGSRRLKQTTITGRRVNGLDEVLTLLKKYGTDALIKLDAIVSSESCSVDNTDHSTARPKATRGTDRCHISGIGYWPSCA